MLSKDKSVNATQELGAKNLRGSQVSPEKNKRRNTTHAGITYNTLEQEY